MFKNPAFHYLPAAGAASLFMVVEVLSGPASARFFIFKPGVLLPPAAGAASFFVVVEVLSGPVSARFFVPRGQKVLHPSFQNETVASFTTRQNLTELRNRGIVCVATDGMQGAMPCNLEGSSMIMEASRATTDWPPASGRHPRHDSLAPIRRRGMGLSIT